MDRTGDARIEGVHRAQHFERLVRIGDRIIDQRSLVGAGPVIVVARAGIPGRRHDALVVLDLAVLDHDPMRQHAPRRLVEADAGDLALREDRPVEGRHVAFGDIVDQQLPLRLQLVEQHGAAHRPRGDAADGRMHRIERDLGPRHGRRDLQHAGEVLLGRLVSGHDHGQHIGERADLRALALEGRRLDPGILAVVLPVGIARRRLALERMQRLAVAGIAVPGVLDALLHAVAEIGIAETLDRLEGGEVRRLDIAAGHGEFRALGVHRQIGHREIIGDARAIFGPVGIHRADRSDVGDHGVVDEVVEFVDPGLDGVEPLQRQRRLAVRIDRIGDAADRQILDVRRLRAEHSHDLVGDALHVERLDVMGGGEQVDVRRQLHRRMAPIARGIHAELARADEFRELVAHGADGRLAVALVVGERGADLGRARRIALQRRDDIDPIERREMIEMHDVIVHAMRGDDQVADVLRIERNFERERILDRAHRGDGVHGRAHPANALREHPGVARVAAFQDHLDAAPHLPGRPGLAYLAVVDLAVDAQMSFDAGDRIDDDAGHDACLSAAWRGGLARTGSNLQNRMNSRTCRLTSPTVIISSGTDGKYLQPGEPL